MQALLAYQAGTRADSIMGGAVQTLSRQQLEDVAAYFAAQKGLTGGLAAAWQATARPARQPGSPAAA